MRKNNLLNIKNITVNKEILKAKFACDLSRCKGACCTMESNYGAPLLGKEIPAIKKNLKGIFKYLPKYNIEEIQDNDFSEIKDKELFTRSINNKECVFVYYQNGIAKCGIEKAFIEGDSDFRKPISCHLFPIRVSDYGGDVLRYEKYDQCKPAKEKGLKEKVDLIDFCKDSLVRLHGEDWYEELKESLNRND